MKVFVAVFFSLVIPISLFAQDVGRDQKIRQFKELNAQLKELNVQIDRAAEELLAVSAADTKAAEIQGAKAFRLLSPEAYAGRGNYYSFTSQSHNYQKVAQIALGQNSLQTGFAGADYGLLADLGEIPLSGVDETPQIAFLLKYKVPTNILDARVEQRQAREYVVDSATFKDRLPAVVGRTYTLRSVSFNRADTIVAFRIERKEADDSLIIFWKSIAEFEKPTLDPNVREY